MFTYPYHFALKIKSLIYNYFVLVYFLFSFFFLLVKVIKESTLK